MAEKTKEEKFNEHDNNNNSLVLFTKLNKYFLIPFLAPIFCMLSNYCIALLIATNVVKKLEFVGTIYMEIFYMLTGILHFLPYFRKNIGKGDGTKKANIGMKYFHRKESNYHNYCKLGIFIILLGLLLSTFELFMVIILDKTKFEIRLYFIFCVPFFSKFILKEHLYQHHYFSLIIAVFGIILLFIPICLIITK